MSKIIFYITMIIWVGSCAYPVDDIPASEDKIIVHSEFSFDEDIKIYLYHGLGLPSPDLQPVIPEQASVEVFLDGVPLEINRIDSLIPYYEVRSKNLIGDDYLLKLSLPEDGLLEVRGRTYIPPSAKLKNLEFNIDSSAFNGDTRVSYLSLAFDIDGEHPDQFYELKFLPVYGSREFSLNDTLWHPISNAWVKPKDRHLLAEGITWSSSRESFLIDFYKLENKRINLKLKLIDAQGEPLNKIPLQLKTHNEAGFQYLYSYEKSLESHQTEFPVLVSNIENGIGVFTGYSYTLLHLIVDHN